MKKLMISLIMVGSIYSAGISAAAAAASNPGESAHSEWFSGVRGLPTTRETGEVASDVVRSEVKDYFKSMGDLRFHSAKVVDGEVGIPPLDGLSKVLNVPDDEFLESYITIAEANFIFTKTGIEFVSPGCLVYKGVALTVALVSGEKQ